MVCCWSQPSWYAISGRNVPALCWPVTGSACDHCVEDAAQWTVIMRMQAGTHTFEGDDEAMDTYCPVVASASGLPLAEQ